MWQPKRVWSNNKTVWDGKKSVWLQDWELKTYDGSWEDAGSDLQTYWNQWEEVSEDAILDVYDSNTPEPIWTPEDLIEATYTFKDYDGTVLKTGKVKDGETPVAPADPTREHYTFQWWNPTVWPISKNTEFVAVYIPENYTFTINVENLPKGADIDWEIVDPETGETLEEISVSSFPMAIDFWTINIDWDSHEWDWGISITSLKEEWADKIYQINISCYGYKPLFEAVWFDFSDAWDWSYSWVIEAINLDSNVSLTISFTPVGNPAE